MDTTSYVWALQSRFFNVRDFGALGDGTNDDHAAIQAAIAAANASTFCKTVYFPAGYYRISDTVDPGLGAAPGSPCSASLVGAGCQVSVIQALPSIIHPTVLFAPSGTGYLDRITVDGLDHANGNNGILATTTGNHNPYGAAWGSVDIVECDVGFRVEQTATGNNIFYNDFGSMRIRDVNIGVQIESVGAKTEPNANHFGFLSVSGFNTIGLKIVSPAGWSIGFFHAESAVCSVGAIGIDVLSSNNFVINGGYIELYNAADDAIRLTPHYAVGFEWHGHIGQGNVTASAEDQQYNFVLLTPTATLNFGAGPVTVGATIPKFYGRLQVQTLGWDDGSIQQTAAPNPTALPSPTTLGSSVEIVGAGTLAPGTYYYRIASRNSHGVSTPLAEHAVVVAHPNGAVKVDWDPVPGATSYDIFGRAAGAEQLIHNFVVIPGAYTTTDWLDNGTAVPAGALPTRNSTADYALAGKLTAGKLAVPFGLINSFGHNGAGNINVSGANGNPPLPGDTLDAVMATNGTVYTVGAGGGSEFNSLVGDDGVGGGVIVQQTASNLSAVLLLFFWHR